MFKQDVQRSEIEKNIINLYGEKGRKWLENMPNLMVQLANSYGLSNLKPVSNLSYNYVLSGFQGNNPIILKIGLDIEGLTREAFALKCFTSCGAVKILSEDDGMLLLERATPGTSLKSYFHTCHSRVGGNLALDPRFHGDDSQSIEIACGVIKKLHQANIPAAHNFPHIKDWLTALDKDCNIPDEYLQKARKLRDRLVQNAGPDVLLHGDLHHDNILQNNNDWLVIDPKGVIGEPAYEVATFVRNPIPELLHHADAPNIIHGRVNRFAELLALPSQRILDWCFVQAVLAWVWALEDGLDTSYFEQLTKIF